MLKIQVINIYSFKSEGFFQPRIYFNSNDFLVLIMHSLLKFLIWKLLQWSDVKLIIKLNLLKHFYHDIKHFTHNVIVS
jgi:hypothetical protein